MTRRFGGPIATGAAALTAILLAFAAATPASAAQLTVRSSGISTSTANPCTRDSFAATTVDTANATKVTLTGIVPACRNRALQVFLLDANGNALASKQGINTAEGATTSVAGLTPYNPASVSSVAVFVDGWWIDTTWTAPVTGPYSCVELTAWPGAQGGAPASYGTPTGNTCTVSYTYFDAWGGTPPKHFNLHFTVSGVTTGNWRVTINFADPYFQGMVPKGISGNGNPLAAPGYSCSQMPVFVGQANLTWALNDRKNGYLSGNSVGNNGSICS